MSHENMARKVAESNFSKEKDRIYSNKPILVAKNQPKTTETPQASLVLEEVRIIQKTLMDKMKTDQTVGKAEWQALARHARKAAKLAPKHEHDTLIGIAETADLLQ
ncbi:MAG: hypothetical protein WCT49_03555 [Candidatus Paceibacterota bacterium]|jgi:hypothetical protein|nr:hypothetical protein [Candidatus Paceibacterota bacterium]